MDTTPGTRGIVIGDRYRVAGTLRRTGLIDAVDLEADRSDAACRVVGVPGDAEGVDAWEDAWRAVQDAARLPRLREIVADDEGAQWAILAATPAARLPLPPDAHAQAREIGEALAEAGLDVGDVTRSMLIADEHGRLCVDSVVWLGGDWSPRAAGRVLAGLVPRVPEVEPEVAPAGPGDWSPPRRRTPHRRPRRSRLLVPGAIIAALAAATVVLLVPARSEGTAVVAPGSTAGVDDVVLGSAANPLVDPQIVPIPAVDAADIPVDSTDVTVTAVAGASDAADANGAPAPTSTAATSETVTVTVVAAARPSDPVRTPAAPELPVAAAQHVPDLPLADAAPSLPLAAGG